MPIHNINIWSESDCQELIVRIRRTLSAKGYAMNRIQETPGPFPPNDDGVLEGLSGAILSIRAVWASVQSIWPDLKGELSNFHIKSVAALTDNDIQNLFGKYRRKVRARSLKDQLFAIRDNAKVFQRIMSEHGSVCDFIKSYLPAAAYDPSYKCYIRPADAPLIKCFTDPKGTFKLRKVGAQVCCEFFNNIGIDAFKADVHTIRFLNRINLDRTEVRVSRKPDDVRQIGTTIANTLQKPRKFVDSHIWCFCAEGEGEICTDNDPKCDLCFLYTEQPQFCKGFPNRTQIVNCPLGAATRLRECNLTRTETAKKMKWAGLTQGDIDKIVTKIYDQKCPPKVKWEDIETFIKANPSGSAEMMKQSGLSYADTYKYMKKAGLAPGEIGRILSKVYSNSEQ